VPRVRSAILRILPCYRRRASSQKILRVPERFFGKIDGQAGALENQITRVRFSAAGSSECLVLQGRARDPWPAFPRSEPSAPRFPCHLAWALASPACGIRQRCCGTLRRSARCVFASISSSSFRDASYASVALRRILCVHPRISRSFRRCFRSSANWSPRARDLLLGI